MHFKPVPDNKQCDRLPRATAAYVLSSPSLLVISVIFATTISSMYP